MVDNSAYLAHHGIKGQRWGYRRWQNDDGTLTPAGKEHYSKGLAGFRKNRKEAKIGKLDKTLARQEQWLNDPKIKARLAQANSKNETYNRRKLEYERAQARADRAILFQNHKQRVADRKQRRMQKSIPARSQRFIERYADASYEFAKTQMKRDSKANSYIKRYGMESYDDMMGLSKASFRDKIEANKKLDVGELSDGTLMVMAKKGQIRDAYVSVKDKSTGQKVALTTVRFNDTCKAMQDLGYTPEEIAKKLNVSPSTVNRVLK